jgi:uncharacterized protein YkwD
VLVLRSPLEDPLSAKRVKRRVRAFVMLAIAAFLAGGIAANSLWSAAHAPAPPTTPARDAVGTPERPADSTPTPSASPSHRRPPHRASRRRTRPSPSRSKAALVTGLSAEDTAVRLTNAQRSQHGCGPLRTDARLRAAARDHSADMRDQGYFDHDTPDGTSPWDRIKAVGYSVPGAENIARDYRTAAAVVAGWMDSPGHRANILNCDLKAVGIGVAYGPSGPWWTQDFGFR